MLSFFCFFSLFCLLVLYAHRIPHPMTLLNSTTKLVKYALRVFVFLTGMENTSISLSTNFPKLYDDYSTHVQYMKALSK